MKNGIRLAVTLVFVVCFSLALLTAWTVWASRERALNEVKVNSLNLTQALDTYSESVIKQSSMLLLGLVERLENEKIDVAQIERIRKLVSEQQYLLAQVNGITIYGQNGEWLMASTGEEKAPFANSSDRAFFIHHQNDPSREAFIGPPIRSRSTHNWVITVSRRIDNRQGQFAGVVAVTLGIRNFLDLFGKIDVGQDGAIGLTYTDGQMLVRYPFREQDMERNFSTSPLYTRYLVDRSVGTASYVSSLDGVERLYAFRRNESLPLVTTVAIGKSEALTAWRSESLLSAGVVLVLLFAVSGIGWLLIKDIKRRIEAESDLTEAREALLEINKQLKVLASRDQLTGIANRRTFDETLASETNRAHREGSMLALLMIDIDHFKRFNDTYGHVAGDECIKAVSEAIRCCLKRPSDFVARYGGEELAVILPNTDLTGAIIVAEHILQTLMDLNILHGESPFERVTASIGVASKPGAQLLGRQLELIEAADQALYRAKAAGRNRLMVDG
ncbi:diguanylate cyclase [Pseudomonas syringae]|uniref:diguanylate cyclase n=1 Tax=Pseudomonas syringae TaxID=317 RepID=A0A1C7Z7S8_PSESX|nr:sensor domain-containing diguanylate cyclase [Pseudomonas syringae]OCR25991.1 diguanylate cyclase [Pseudomonas syringae]